MRQLQDATVWKKCLPLVLNCGPETQNNQCENALEIKMLVHRSSRGVRVTILRNLYNALLLKSECVDIQNNLMKMLNHPMQQKKKLRLREGMNAPILSAGQWESQYLISSRSLLFSPPSLHAHSVKGSWSALVELGLQSHIVNARLADVTRYGLQWQCLC